uniref:Uncharacterized protein n=1 Tax=Magallana gigas TaxID=29159 RepID=K1Q8F3_MAGGI
MLKCRNEIKAEEFRKGTHYTEEEPACLPLNFRTNAADFGRVVAIIKLSQHIAVNIAYILVMQLAHFVFEYSDNTWDGYKYRTFLARNEAESLVSLTDSTIEKETSIDEYESSAILPDWTTEVCRSGMCFNGESDCRESCARICREQGGRGFCYFDNFLSQVEDCGTTQCYSDRHSCDSACASHCQPELYSCDLKWHGRYKCQCIQQVVVQPLH